MKIYALTLLKNDEDVIEFTLKEALSYADKIITLSNGSTDRTWEIVQSMKDERIVPYQYDDCPYTDGLRARMFHAFKHEMTEQDWWVVQDSDEVFHVNPKDLLKDQRASHFAQGKKIDLYYDLDGVADSFIPDPMRLREYFDDFRYYIPSAWSEPRAIRHRKGLIWNEKEVWPRHMGVQSPITLPIRHYPNRYPKQVFERWKTRIEVIKEGGQYASQWDFPDFRVYMDNLKSQVSKIHQGVDIFETTPIKNNYRQSTSKRLLKRLLHGVGVFK